MIAVQGVGLGLRREMLTQMCQQKPAEIDFFEIAPENWIPFGGKLQKQLAQLTAQHRFFCHGLSLSIGGPAPIDIAFVKQIKAFLQQHNIETYSEHLSYCSGAGHLYDLMPIPFTAEAVDYVANRVKQVQDILEQPLILENVSYYAAPGQEMSELDFTLSVLQQADCKMLLDVNNIYVNSVNHGYKAEHYLQQIPSERIAYYHIAGHYQQEKDLLIDTHGADVIDPVWRLLALAYQQHGVKATLLERDFNIPTWCNLQAELNQIHQLQYEANGTESAKIKLEPAL
ncbi:HvfB family MNIO-type RiPP peptide maturase [Rheinheimera sp. WS51]|uniref:HvfB family MNIO-type RiPP peptide maturase n=1 Tax=Rheinheimera sp. WS51 TaxID=3425886 RepID=UPI003D93CB0D